MAKTRKRTTLTHVDSKGAARMVDVSGKPATRRTATARARMRYDVCDFMAKAVPEARSPG